MTVPDLLDGVLDFGEVLQLLPPRVLLSPLPLPGLDVG